MTNIISQARRVWKSAQLYIGFHRDPEGKMRGAPHVWPPKNGKATIHRDPDEQETFVVLKSAHRDSDQDIQIVNEHLKLTRFWHLKVTRL